MPARQKQQSIKIQHGSNLDAIFFAEQDYQFHKSMESDPIDLCMHGSAWRGDGAKLLLSLAKALSV